MKIYIGSDHAGYNLKEHLVPYIQGLGFEVADAGAKQYDIGDDYPTYISKVAKAVSNFSHSRKGIVLGGSGNGEAMMANRFPGVRAAVFYGGALPVSSVDAEGKESRDPLEIVRLSRLHNDANVLSIGARFVSEDEAKQAVKVWLETKFEGEDRHMRRVRMLDTLAPHGKVLRYFVLLLLAVLVVVFLVLYRS